MDKARIAGVASQVQMVTACDDEELISRVRSAHELSKNHESTFGWIYETTMLASALGGLLEIRETVPNKMLVVDPLYRFIRKRLKKHTEKV